MKIQLYCDAEEMKTNIGIAKSLTEMNLSPKDLQEIALHLLVFSGNFSAEKDGELDG